MTEIQFAQALGFEDYDALLAASEVVAHERGNDVQWYITRLHDGRWAAWDDAELDIDRVGYAEHEIGAIDLIYDGLVAAGYDCTGEPVVEKYRVWAEPVKTGGPWYENEFTVHAYGHMYYANGEDEADAIRQVLGGAGEHDPTCCHE